MNPGPGLCATETPPQPQTPRVAPFLLPPPTSLCSRPQEDGAPLEPTVLPSPGPHLPCTPLPLKSQSHMPCSQLLENSQEPLPDCVTIFMASPGLYLVL